MRKLAILTTLIFIFTLTFGAVKDIFKIGEDVVVPRGSEVNSVFSLGGDIRVYGKVLNDVVTIGGDVRLYSTAEVDGSVVAVGGSVNQNSGARIGKELVEGSIADIAATGKHWDKWDTSQVSTGWKTFNFIRILGLIALSLLIAALFPSQIGLISSKVESAALSMFGWGLLAFMVSPIIIVLLAITLIGIPLIPLYGICFMLALLLGFISVAQVVGKRVTQAVGWKNIAIIWELLTGLVLLALIGWVPVLGGIIKAIILIIGIGAVLKTLLSLRKPGVQTVL